MLFFRRDGYGIVRSEGAGSERLHASPLYDEAFRMWSASIRLKQEEAAIARGLFWWFRVDVGLGVLTPSTMVSSLRERER
jgi:hypothetical protein